MRKPKRKGDNRTRRPPSGHDVSQWTAAHPMAVSVAESNEQESLANHHADKDQFWSMAHTTHAGEHLADSHSGELQRLDAPSGQRFHKHRCVSLFAPISRHCSIGTPQGQLRDLEAKAFGRGLTRKCTHALREITLHVKM